jgi:acyl carrier protein
MVNQMKTVQAELTKMLRGKMSGRLPHTNVAEHSLETLLEDLGLDSPGKLCLLFKIEDLFNVAIPDAIASQMKCGADILAYVASSQRGPSH